MEAALSHLSQAPPLLSRSKSNFFNFRNPNLIITKFIPNLHKYSSSLSSSSSVVDSDSPTLGSRARNDFSTIHQGVDGFNRIYFDNAKSSKKPDSVLKAMNDYYESYNSNVHRGIHALSAKATDAYELARLKVAKFINAKEYREIVFTRNATEAINLVAYSWGLSNIKSGDEILLTIAEHHSAISPWQFVAKRTGATLKFVYLNKDQILDIEQLKKLLSTKTKLVVTHHTSHILGTVMPICEVVAWSHEVGAKVLIDACQSVPHMAVDVQKLDADFLVVSSHKMCGPTGIGFLYGKSKILTSMPPYLGGGEMIADVFEDYSTYAEPPSRFEAGTPAIAEAIGLGAAVDYLSSIGMQNIQDYEEELANYLYHGLLSIPDIRIYGPTDSNIDRHAAICSFNVDNVSSEDIATHLNEKFHVAVGFGHHCAQPLHQFLGISSSVRASLRFYNTKEEVDFFIQALKDTVRSL